MHLFVHFPWKDKWLNMQVHTDLWAMTNGLVGWSETLKQHDWITGNKDFWKEVCGLTFLNG